MKNKFMICVLTLFVTIMATSATASTISVNCASDWAELILESHEVAGYGPYRIDNWNNVPGNAAGTELWDNTGVMTGAIMDFQISNTWGDGSVVVDSPDAKIARQYFDDWGTSDGWAVQIQVTDVPYIEYDVIIYATADGGTSLGEFDVNGVKKSGIPVADGDLYGWTEWILDEYVLVFEGITGSTLDIKTLERGRGTVAGFQIVQSLRAYSPDPANGAERVPLDKILSWYTAIDPNDSSQPNPLVTKHFVYMSSGDPADPNVTLKATIDAGSPPAATGEYDPPLDLLRDGEYWWRVDEGLGADPNPEDPNDIITGGLWTFKPVTSQAMLDPALPEDSYVYIGDDATFTVDAVNPFTMDNTGLGYEWFKVGITEALSTNDTLIIPNVQLADEGEYYCTVTTISNGSTINSRSAKLTVKRAIGWWKLDGDGLDSSDLQNHGDVIGGGSQQNWWVDGMDGEAMNVGANTTGAPYVQVAAADALDYNLTKKISVAVWVKSLGTPNGYGVLVGKQLDNVNRPWMLRQNDINPWITWKTHGDFWIVDTVRCFDDTWHHVVATWDIDTGEKKVYMDGVLKGSKGGMFSEALSDDVSPVRIGYYYSTYYFDGLLDDAQIYNYALAPQEVAELYIGYIPGTEVCMEDIPSDLNNDCMVDLADFVIVAEDWMDCNRVPASACP